VCGAVQWGDVPTWLGAVATFVALAFAAIAARAARDVYRIESHRDEDAEVDRRSRDLENRRSQAAKVSGWCGYGGVTLTGKTIDRIQGLLLRNASELPVFDLTTRYFVRQGANTYAPVVRVPASAQWPDGHKGWVIPILPPQDHAVFFSIPEEVFAGVHANLRDTIAPGLTFRDADGVRWQRHPSGALEELA
jgi:arabinogalactan oligomer/maltooligosaccharide transport system substrate-binding protein